MKVSVIVPVYNVETYLHECLISIRKQSFENLDIVCIDDGSTDGSLGILLREAEFDDRIRVIQQQNQGLSAARNAGLKAAEGDYCLFCDSDDVLESNAIEVLLDKAVENNLDILYYSGIPFCDDDCVEEHCITEKNLWRRTTALNDVDTGANMFCRLMAERAFVSPVQIQFYNAEFLNRNQLFFSNGYIHEDLIYTYQAALLAKRVMCIADVLYKRRVRPDSIVTSAVSGKNFEGRFNVFFEVSRFNEKMEGDVSAEIWDNMEAYRKLALSNSIKVYCRLDSNQRKKIRIREGERKMLYDEINYEMYADETVVGYGENLRQKNDIILIGAGEIGKKALEYFGKYRVRYFADNDKCKIGTSLEGIEIIAVSELGGFDKNAYDFVICSRFVKELEIQLKELKIKSIYKFISSDVYELENFLAVNEFRRYSKIALYGTGKDAKKIVENFQFIPGAKIMYVVDHEDSSLQGQDWNGYSIKTVRDVLDEADCLIVGTARYHMAVNARLQNITMKLTVLDPFQPRYYYNPNKLLINNYGDDAFKERSEEEYIERESKRLALFDAISAYVQEVNKMDKVPLFGHVEIETVNRCNGGCSFCPVSAKRDTRVYYKMTEDLFKNIILQLEELNYAGRIAPFSNNEPFLDERIIELTAFMREHLPKARIHMFTNGTLLTVDKYVQIIQYLDELIIDNYNQRLEMIPSVKKIYDYCIQHPELIRKTDIVLRKSDEILSTRGGDAPNRSIKKKFGDVKCALPYRQLIIRPTGEVSLCCNDPLGKYTLGDVNKEKLVDIWYGERFGQIREKLNQGRGNVPHCEFCDTFYLN